MEKLSGKSMDIVADNITKLKELFPEILTENKINFNTLKALLGEDLEEAEERYSFTWHGKAQARRLAQTATDTLCSPQHRRHDGKERRLAETIRTGKERTGHRSSEPLRRRTGRRLHAAASPWAVGSHA